MKKIITSSVAIAIVLAFAVNTHAAPPNMKPLNNRVVSNYHLQNGTRFSQGFCYKGQNHCHWSYSCFDARYGCTCYWDPCQSIWYYWCQPDTCYYPVSYCPYRTYCNYTTTVVTQPVCTPVVQTVCVQPICIQPVCTTYRPICTPYAIPAPYCSYRFR